MRKVGNSITYDKYIDYVVSWFNGPSSFTVNNLQYKSCYQAGEMAPLEIFHSICLLQRNMKLAIFNYFESNAMEIIMAFPRTEKMECTLCVSTAAVNVCLMWLLMELRIFPWVIPNLTVL